MANVQITPPDKLKAEFQEAVRAEGKSMNQVIVELMLRYVLRRRKKQEDKED